MCSAIVSYLGNFTQSDRLATIEEWLNLLDERGLYSSDGFSLKSVLGEPVRIREWHLLGLPSDSYSDENAIIMTRRCQ